MSSWRAGSSVCLMWLWVLTCKCDREGTHFHTTLSKLGSSQESATAAIGRASSQRDSSTAMQVQDSAEDASAAEADRTTASSSSFALGANAELSQIRVGCGACMASPLYFWWNQHPDTCRCCCALQAVCACLPARCGHVTIPQRGQVHAEVSWLAVSCSKLYRTAEPNVQSEPAHIS